MIECKCGNSDCEKQLHFGENSLTMVNCTETTSDHLFFMDANTLVQLIVEAKRALMDMVD